MNCVRKTRQLRLESYGNYVRKNRGSGWNKYGR